MNKNARYYIWLSMRCGEASKSPDKLLNYFNNDISKVYEVSENEYLEVKGLSRNLIASLCDKDTNECDKIIAYCESNGVGILVPEDDTYPERLKLLEDRPMVLYYKGEFPDIDNRLCVAVVGTRHQSYYGERSTYTISYDLARAGAVIVSGMAAGCDTSAHKAALDSGGLTLAVLGCGIDTVYPASNRELMENIMKVGCVVSEYAPGTPPKGYNFPKRNRIISGLCNCTFVTEAPQDSGSLITAEFALKQGRNVFALPGKIGETNSRGTNELIQNGAYAVTCAYDIICHYDKLFSNNLKLFKSQINKKELDDKAKNQSEKIKIKENIIPVPYSEISKPEPKIREDKNAYLKNSQNNSSRVFEAKFPKHAEKENAVFNIIMQKSPITVDEIVKISGFETSQVASLFTILELKGFIKILPGGSAVPKK